MSWAYIAVHKKVLADHIRHLAMTRQHCNLCAEDIWLCKFQHALHKDSADFQLVRR